MIERLRDWWHRKLRKFAHDYLYEHDQNYRDLHDWLTTKNDLSSWVLRNIQGARLSFAWVDAPERGRLHGIVDNLTRESVFLKALQGRAVVNVGGAVFTKEDFEREGK